MDERVVIESIEDVRRDHVNGDSVGVRGTGRGMGWLPDLPDHRDYTIETAAVQSLLKGTGTSKALKAPPESVDLRAWCSPIENQRSLGSCTACAGVGLVEYSERKAFGRHLNASKRFLYKATRKLGHFEGDSGAFLRTTIGAMALFGVPPEEYWPYTTAEKEWDREPPAFCYAFAQNYQALTYYRLDPPGTARPALLDQIKAHLASQLPSMFGFTCYDTLFDPSVDATGKIPFPGGGEAIVGGHAVDAVGYDDKLKIPNPAGGPTTTGAFLIRNSWGKEWGQDGYGWIPYRYVLDGLAEDFWVLLTNEWVDTKAFKP
jgi:C1A family cysteine protease